MKSSTFWLCLSLVANVALLAGIVIPVRQPNPVPAITTPVSGVDAPTRPVTVAPLPEASIEAPPPTNLQACINLLRDAGAPSRILARMVIQDFEERWQQRLEEMQGSYARGELDRNPLDVLNAERADEQEKELRAALGAAGFREWDQAQTLQSLNLKNVLLSADETNAIYSLHKELQSQLRALDAARLRGDIDPEEYGDACNAAQQDHDEKNKKLLGPERFAIVRSPTGVTDSAFEHALHKLNASVDQIESVLKLQQNYAARRADLERQIQDNPRDAGSLDDQLRALDAALNEERQGILGVAASQALQREQDYRYQTMKRRAGAWNLNAGQIDFIYQYIRSYEKSVDDYHREAHAMESRGELVDWGSVTQNLLHYSQQNEQTLEGFLGVEQFKKLEKNHLLPFARP
jgi:hypothetical protein